MCKSPRQYNIKNTKIYIYCTSDMTYYSIWQSTTETCPHTTLHNSMKLSMCLKLLIQNIYFITHSETH